MILIGGEFLRDAEKKSVLTAEEGKPLIFAVADGMGGLERGEEASQFVLSELRGFFSKIPDDLDESEIKGVLETFTAETHAKLPQDTGSTLVGALFYRGKFYRFHTGDSRLYLFRDGGLTRLTVDHSEREMGGDPTAPSNIILNSFGGGGKAFIEFTPLDPLKKKDILLLSSDGLHDLLDTWEIEKNMQKWGDSVQKLLSAAKERGGKDNISILQVEIKEL
jgi:protein phosphatase